ncbi:MAG: hypothetical protein K2Y28_00825 [Burkholderiaceae bacterium]|nr:hypothetical protein [Burkholderiaceae bacterium]
MSHVDPIEIVENDVLVVVVQGEDGGYFMWQKGLTKEVGSDDGIYFEFNDQIKGSFNQVKECTITNDGIQVKLSNGNSEHFYFPPNFDKLDELKVGLNKIYAEQGGIVAFNI